MNRLVQSFIEPLYLVIIVYLVFTYESRQENHQSSLDKLVRLIKHDGSIRQLQDEQAGIPVCLKGGVHLRPSITLFFLILPDM